MSAIRAPFSALGGALFSVALFLGLAHLVNVPFDVASPTVAKPVELRPVRPDTPEHNVRDPQPVRKPPTLEPNGMISWSQFLTPEEAELIRAYVATQARTLQQSEARAPLPSPLEPPVIEPPVIDPVAIDPTAL